MRPVLEFRLLKGQYNCIHFSEVSLATEAHFSARHANQGRPVLLASRRTCGCSGPLAPVLLQSVSQLLDVPCLSGRPRTLLPRVSHTRSAGHRSGDWLAMGGEMRSKTTHVMSLGSTSTETTFLVLLFRSTPVSNGMHFVLSIGQCKSPPCTCCPRQHAVTRTHDSSKVSQVPRPEHVWATLTSTGHQRAH